MGVFFKVFVEYYLKKDEMNFKEDASIVIIVNFIIACAIINWFVTGRLAIVNSNYLGFMLLFILIINFMSITLTIKDITLPVGDPFMDFPIIVILLDTDFRHFITMWVVEGCFIYDNSYSIAVIRLFLNLIIFEESTHFFGLIKFNYSLVFITKISFLNIEIHYLNHLWDHVNMIFAEYFVGFDWDSVIKVAII